MPPRSALRTNGKSKLTPADKVRLEWNEFEGWLEIQRKEADIRTGEALHDLQKRMEATKRSLPKGFHPTLMKEYENERRMIIDGKEEKAMLVMRSRVEWEERLEKAGLKAEDWDPMTFAEQEAVRAALAGDSDEEEEHVSSHQAQDMTSHWNVANTHQEVPAVAKRFSETQRMNTLSPLPDLPEWLRSRTPNSVPPTPPRTQDHKSLLEAMYGGKSLGTRYTGPVLIEDDKIESLEDADFAEFKMSIREQMIREFHEEATRLEIILVRKEHEVKLKADAVKALLAGHELNMEELRQMKEDKRKEIVDAERTRRKADIKRRNTGPKDVPGMQGQSSVRMESTSLRKGPSQDSGSYNAQIHRGKQTKSEAVPSPTTEPRPKSPVVIEQLQTPVTDSVRRNPAQPTGSKTETKKQKNGKGSKKGTTSRMKQPELKNDSISDKQPVEPRLVENARQKKEPQTKDQSRLKATVEEVSDTDASARMKCGKEIPKQHASVRVDRFAEPYFTPSPHQVESTTDEDWAYRFAQATVPSQFETRRKREKSFSANQRHPSDFEEISGYRYASSGEMKQQRDGVQESAGSAEEMHAVWRPPVVFDDESGEENQDLLRSLTFGAKGTADSTSRIPRAEAGWSRMVPNMLRTSESQNAGKKDPAKNRNVSKRGEVKVTGYEMESTQNNPAELGNVDDSATWEAAMMQKFIGLAHTSL